VPVIRLKQFLYAILDYKVPFIMRKDLPLSNGPQDAELFGSLVSQGEDLCDLLCFTPSEIKQIHLRFLDFNDNRVTSMLETKKMLYTERKLKKSKEQEEAAKPRLETVKVAEAERLKKKVDEQRKVEKREGVASYLIEKGMSQQQ
jgi:hypothetical protein